MSKPRLRQWPSLGAITIADGVTENIPLGGSFFRVREANAPFKIQFDDDDALTVEENDVFAFSEFSKFKKITVLNDSGGDLTFQLQIGDGEVRTSAITFSGSVDIGADIAVGTYNNLRVYDANVLDVEKLLNGTDEGLIQGVTDLTGTSHFTQSGAATGTLISAAANTGGVILKIINLNAQGSAGRGRVKLDTNTILEVIGDNDGPANAIEKNIKVAAGVKIEVQTAGSADFVTITYEAL